MPCYNAPSPKRLSELESLKVRCRHLVFDEARGKQATRILRAVRARIAAADDPQRRERERLSRKARDEQASYLQAALSGHKLPPTEREAQAQVEHLCGGVQRGFRLLHLKRTVEDITCRAPGEAGGDFQRRIQRRFAIAARGDGFPPEAVSALLAFQGRRSS